MEGIDVSAAGFQPCESQQHPQLSLNGRLPWSSAACCLHPCQLPRSRPSCLLRPCLFACRPGNYRACFPCSTPLSLPSQLPCLAVWLGQSSHFSWGAGFQSALSCSTDFPFCQFRGNVACGHSASKRSPWSRAHCARPCLHPQPCSPRSAALSADLPSDNQAYAGSVHRRNALYRKAYPATT